MRFQKERKVLHFEADVPRNMDNDPDLAELFDQELKWRLEKAVATTIRVCEQRYAAFYHARQAERNARIMREHQELMDQLRRERDESDRRSDEDRLKKQRQQEEELARMFKDFAESIGQFNRAPAKESPIRRDDETEDQFLLRMADNANARRKWAQRNLNK